MNDQVVAHICLGAGAGHVLPAERHRAALHGFAGKRFAVVVHHAGRVRLGALRHHRARVHHDADEIVIPGQCVARFPATCRKLFTGSTQVQQGQYSLYGNCQGDLVGDQQTVAARELFAAQEGCSQVLHAGLLGNGQLLNKRVLLQHPLPQIDGNSGRKRCH